MLAAAASTWSRSAEPSSAGGVPTAMKTMVPSATALAASVVKCNRPAAALRSTSSLRPGTWIGISPRFRPATRSLSMSTQATLLPISAMHAEVTRPT